jgi:hypothetical protein
MPLYAVAGIQQDESGERATAGGEEQVTAAGRPPPGSDASPPVRLQTATFWPTPVDQTCNVDVAIRSCHCCSRC